jgi:hypothetical protein
VTAIVTELADFGPQNHMKTQNSSQDRFTLSFDLSPLGTLDKFGLLATQIYNLGDRGNWFYYFRASAQGVDSRVYGISLHYYELHAWLPKRRHRTETEYHLASLFFNMDSVVECFVYMMNALGFAADALSFKDITNQKAMRAIAPRNVIGDAKQSPLVGYGKFFPNVQKLWVDNRALIELIMEQHDVTKHRFAYGLNGRSRNDPPPGFFESLNIDLKFKYEFSPVEEILLETEPKIHFDQRTASRAYEDAKKLEPVAEEFAAFINASCKLVVRDATQYINLPYYRFLDTAGVVCESDLDLYCDEDCTIKRNDIRGLMIGTEYIGHSVMRGHIVPITRFGYYRKGYRLKEDPKQRDTKKVWDKSWYIDPIDGQKKSAWGSSAEFVGEQEVP